MDEKTRFQLGISESTTTCSRPDFPRRSRMRHVTVWPTNRRLQQRSSSEFPSTHRSREGRHRCNHTRGWVPPPAPAPIIWSPRASAHHAYSTSRPGVRCVESIRGGGRECLWPATTRIALDSTNAALGLPKLGDADGGMYCGYDCAHLGELLIVAWQFRGHYVLSDQVSLRLWESPRTRSRLLRHV